MRVRVEIQKIERGNAKCLVLLGDGLGDQRFTLDINVSACVDHETIETRLKSEVHEIIRRKLAEKHQGKHVKLSYEFDLDIDETPPPPPCVRFNDSILDIEVFGNADKIIVKAGDRSFVLAPNRHRHASIHLPETFRPISVTVINCNGVASEEVLVS